MAAQKLRITDLSPFDHAAAGHDGVLSDPTGDLIIKPCTLAEIKFYEEAATHPAFHSLIPTYMGTVALSSAAEITALQNGIPANIDISETTIEASVGPKGKKLITEHAIVLENIAAGFVKPNIMDIKLGTRLWADDATLAKRTRLDDVTSKTTSGSLGLRITGMRVWEFHADGSGEYRIYGKEYGKALSEATVRTAFETFFYSRVRPGSDRTKELTSGKSEVVRRVSNEVALIENVLRDEESRMYSSSILIVYEGDDAALDEALVIGNGDEGLVVNDLDKEDVEKESVGSDDDGDDDNDDDDDEDDDDEEYEHKVCAVKLIDFAHASFAPGEGMDQNAVNGVVNVRTILDNILLSP